MVRGWSNSLHQQVTTAAPFSTVLGIKFAGEGFRQMGTKPRFTE